MDADTIFETERLILRPFTTDDLQAVFERTSDPEVMRFHNCGALSFEDTRTGLDHTIRIAREIWPFLVRVIKLKATNQNVGYCQLAPCGVLEGRPVEIAYDVVRKHWNHDYATEASACALCYGFERLRLAEVVAVINPQNLPSARVAQKLGFLVQKQVEWPKQGLVDLYHLTPDAYQRQDTSDPSKRPAGRN